MRHGAARLVGNLSVSGDNFSIAWSLLVTRYENKRFLINSQLDRISDLKPFKTKGAKGLRSLLTTISETIAALRAMGCAVHHWDPLLLYQLVRLLDLDTREAWEVHLGSSAEYPTYAQFEEFLIGRTRAMENLGLAPTTGSCKESAASTTGKTRSKASAHVATSSKPDQITCPLCKSPHSLAKCEKFQSKTIQQKRDCIIKNRRCFNCLAAHLASNCTSTKRCLKCGKKHHTSIHFNSTSVASTSAPSNSKTDTQTA